MVTIVYVCLCFHSESYSFWVEGVSLYEKQAEEMGHAVVEREPLCHFRVEAKQLRGSILR